MQPIIQEDKTRCGFASVATLAGVIYPQVKRVAAQLGIEVQNSQLWSGTTYVLTLLTHYGLSTSPNKKPFESCDNLPSLALLAIKWPSKGTQAIWHWVIFWREQEGSVVLDSKQSLQKHIRIDFGKMKP